MIKQEYGNIAPKSAPAMVEDSVMSKTIAGPPAVLTFCLKAAIKDNAVNTALPMAKPLPVAAVVLPSASKLSVFARTDESRPEDKYDGSSVAC